MLDRDGFSPHAPPLRRPSANLQAPRQPHFAAKAKSVIFLFRVRRTSQVDHV